MEILKTIRNFDKDKKWDLSFMEIASMFANHSSCVKRKVGAVLVKDLRILSTGYNGTPSGLCNCDEVFKKPIDLKDGTLPNGIKITHHDFAEQFEIHAEQNCLSFAAKNGVSTKDCTLYITTAPCVNCAKIIIASGIKKVIYNEIYKNDYGLKLLKAAKIKCESLDT